MIFISYAQLAKDVVSWSEQLPRDIDVIAGIPRSGMLPATILALHRNIKLTTIGSQAVFTGGVRDQHRGTKKILIIDDSLLAGKSIERAKKIFKKTALYGTVYIKPGMEHLIDYHYKTVSLPRIFEWNWLHHFWLQKSCMDIDGVLCNDPTSQENDDGLRYQQFLSTAIPKHIPTVQVHTLVTSRLERYRKETVSWLHKHGVIYKKLIMHPAPDAKTRRQASDHAKRKAAVFRDVQYELFIESSERQAREIFALTKKPVLCTDTMCLIS